MSFPGKKTNIRDDLELRSTSWSLAEPTLKPQPGSFPTPLALDHCMLLPLSVNSKIENMRV